ncbi:MAG: DUF6364 family protein, partial [Gemmatimonadota bacterium]
RMEKSLIKRAKTFARSRGKSVSRLVADYFALLDEPADSEAAATARPDMLPPITKSLRGALQGASLDEQDYRDHLLRKHG